MNAVWPPVGQTIKRHDPEHTREEIELLNVLLISSKVVTMQRLIAEVPEGHEQS